MLVDIDYFVSKTNINKEELERLSNFEIRKAFERMVDIAGSFGLRKTCKYKYTFTEDSNTINLGLLSPPYDIDRSVVSYIYSEDFSTRYSNYLLVLNDNGEPILIFRNRSFRKGETVNIVYENIYTLKKDAQGKITYEIDVNVGHLNILHLIFEGCLYERLSQYYSKLSMQDVGGDLTNNMDRARYYNEQATRFFNDAMSLIKKKFVVGRSIIFKNSSDWLTHDV